MKKFKSFRKKVKTYKEIPGDNKEENWCQLDRRNKQKKWDIVGKIKDRQIMKVMSYET